MLATVESWWAHVATTYSPATIEFVGTLILQLVTFWLPCIIYHYLPRLFPAFSERHKLQPAPKQPSAADVRDAFVTVAGNQLLGIVLHLAQLSAQQHFKGQQSTYVVTPSLPSLPILVRDVLLSLLLREILFYYVHRLFHTFPYLYRTIHKKHHRFTAPIAVAAQYAHPIEQIFANVLPITLPPQILGSHMITFWTYMGYELVNTATVHSGYDFFVGKARFHDEHHERFSLNYGSIGFLDWVHGTDKLRGKGKEKKEN